MALILRDYAPTDASRLVALANNESVSRYLIYTFPFPYTKRDADWWIEVGSRENGAHTKAIEADGTMVGTIGIIPQTGWRAHVAEIGYWLGQEYWGRGIASDALNLMTEWSFSNTPHQKLIAPVLGPNRASMRVLEKCGYQLEGILKHEVLKNGQAYDIHRYARQRT